MSLVIDASVLVLAAEGHAAALDLLSAPGDLHAPDLLLLEVANALRGLERAGVLDAADVERAVSSLGHLAVRRHSHDALMAGIWALRHNLSAYDASYLALAELKGLRLATADVALAQVARKRIGSDQVTLLH